MCIENKNYAGDICIHSVHKQTLNQSESDILIWGEDHTSDNSIKWYKTYDDSYVTDKFKIIQNSKYKNDNESSYQETSVDINLFNLNNECSVPCKEATDCNAFSYIPGNSNVFGKCIFYNAEKNQETEIDQFGHLYTLEDSP